LSNDEAFADRQKIAYQPVGNANISFYSWNLYQTDRKFKSYGMNGETRFYVGREFSNDTIDAKSFYGNFPEFISFPFELTANQRNRVDSYLALKYGLTLAKSESYRSSKNVVFWKSANNSLFSNRIFGFGRDDISGLNQLQSESTHEKNYLVAAVGKILENNTVKQQDANIENYDFIVFGDNGEKPKISHELANGIKRIGRIWLSQSTGNYTAKYDIHFKLNLEGELREKLAGDPGQKIWLIRDRFVNNQQESDFQSQAVDYYPTYQILGEYALFRNIYFDPDSNAHDQFTFGIGPQMIVQLQLTTKDCNDKYATGKVQINGGTPPYYVNIQNTFDGIDYNFNYTIQENYMFFGADYNSTYTITVIDSNGIQAQTVSITQQPSINSNLGPDIVLNASQNQIILNAGLNVNDPGATYKWYHNGMLLDHYQATLTVTQPGQYAVTVTSGNGICQMSDSINVSYEFKGTVAIAGGCSQTAGEMTISLSGGVPPFATSITGPGQNINFVHSNELLSLSELAFGQYTITSTDSNGLVFSQAVALEHPMGGLIDLQGQITSICGESVYQPTIGTGSFACPIPFYITMNSANPNVSYQWFINGQAYGTVSPQVEIGMDSYNGNNFTEIKVVATNSQNGCTASDLVVLKGNFKIISSNFSRETLVQNPQPEPKPFLTAVVYPNPSEKDATFYYKVSSDKIFDGTVEIYNPLGALLQRVPISGNAAYSLDFNLQTAGVYFICTRTNGTILTDKIVIK
ncbi:MAG TPA: T9SS type A sorting domain-containing protein, partial [Flavobacterium sp.]|nr:T9SS type A sorting domain-containing protein [Flavobacterium sp.]